MLDTCHFELHVDSLTSARHFYVDLLGLEILQELPPIRLLALRAGPVRISIFETDTKATGESRAHIIFRTNDLDATLRTLRARGLAFDGSLEEAPGFMKYVSLHDPSGNYLEIAQYLRDPLAATP
jgi:predicted enzyme related to lactoylglutathione lyase